MSIINFITVDFFFWPHFIRLLHENYTNNAQLQTYKYQAGSYSLALRMLITAYKIACPVPTYFEDQSALQTTEIRSNNWNQVVLLRN